MSVCFSNPDIRRLVDAEARIKCMCMALDLYGFRPEKKNKHLMNIDTDASHIFMQGYAMFLSLLTLNYVAKLKLYSKNTIATQE